MVVARVHKIYTLIYIVIDSSVTFRFTGSLLKLGFAFQVCFASDRGPLWVRSSEPRPDPESKPEVRSGSVFCLVGPGHYCNHVAC